MLREGRGRCLGGADLGLEVIDLRREPVDLGLHGIELALQFGVGALGGSRSGRERGAGEQDRTKDVAHERTSHDASVAKAWPSYVRYVTSM